MTLHVSNLRRKFCSALFIITIFPLCLNQQIVFADNEDDIDVSIPPDDETIIHHQRQGAAHHIKKLPTSPEFTVCWEKLESAFRTEMEWVREKIETELSARTPLRFSGWQQCTKKGAFIRIKIDDSEAQTQDIGNALKNVKDGMRLNFTFKNWGNSFCGGDEARRRACIENTSLHEFGHAIGLIHEHNRSDLSGISINNACDKPSQGHNNIDLTIGPWDEESIMNYCNPIHDNGGHLSAWDVESINRIYDGGLRRIKENGNKHLPRVMADVNGDGYKDYCRFIGEPPKIYLSCQFADKNGFRTDSSHHFVSKIGIDAGMNQLPRYFADVNNDKRDDYCRFIENSKELILTCLLAGETGFSETIYRSSSRIDPGLPGLPRYLFDINGDGRSDYCRFLSINNKPVLACNLAEENGFSKIASFRASNNMEIGLAYLPRALVIKKDQIGSRRPAYCRFIGNKGGIYEGCNFVEQNGFSSEVRRFDVERQAWYNR